MAINTSINIKSSVGAKGTNAPADVQAVQKQLNAQMPANRTPLVVDGINGPKTEAAIRDFQSSVLGFRWPDKRVDPNGKTQRALNDPASKAKWIGVTPQPKMQSDGIAVPSPIPSPRDLTDRVVYIHGDQVPDAGKTFDMHKGMDVYHHQVRSGQMKTVILDVADVVISNDWRIRDLVINCHGGGAGRVTFNKEYSGPKAKGWHPLRAHIRNFEVLRPSYHPDAIIYIYACCFASANLEGVNGNDPNEATKSDMNPEGDGIAAMKEIAKGTGCEVRAGFNVQFGTKAGFVGPWVQVFADGSHKIHTEGRALDTGESITRLVETLKSVF